MGFLMTGGIMIAAAAYLWKRRRKTEGAKAAVMLFALVFLYAIIVGGSLEKIWLGYLATLLLSAPIPALMFVSWGRQELEPHGGIPAIIKNTYNNIYGRLGRTGKAPQPLSTFSEKVPTNWPAIMSHHGECDIDPKRTKQTSGSQQPGSRAHDLGPGRRVDGSNFPPHPPHPGGLP